MKTLAEQIADRLTQMIREGGYEPGDRLPTEKELGARLGAGRNTVREALKILASRNVVTVRQGAGTYVSKKQGIADDPLGFSLVTDRKKLTSDLIQIRLILEPPIAALAAQNATKEEIGEMEAILNEMEEAIRGHKEYYELDMAFHRKIAECTHNQVMKNLIPIIGHGIAVFAMEVDSPEYRQTLLTHRRIFRAIKEHKPVEAEMEMRFHLLFNNTRFEEGPLYGVQGPDGGLS